jgi:hypothetical protein
MLLAAPASHCGVPAQVRRHLSSQLVIVGVGPVEEGLD